MKNTRRDFLKTAGMGLAAASLSPAFSSGQGAEGGKRPNVLFISIDDLNDWVGCLRGHPDVKTPNLDRFVERGMLFTRAYCAAPVCNPSRAAIMSGIRPSTSGVYTNAMPWRESPVLADAVTLPQHFMAHGYRAMGAGKIYHGTFPDPPSWDEYWPNQLKTKPDDPRLSEKPPGSRGGFTWGPVRNPNQDMGDWQVADWISDRLQKEHEQPFFLACGIFRPHLPWVVPQEYFDMYPLEHVSLPLVNENDLDDVPEAGRIMRIQSDHPHITGAGAWRKAVQGYLASISFADACLGRVIDALDKSPHRDNTVVVLWSDHGWHLGEKLHWRKAVLWEEATHNVMFMMAPGVTRPHQRCDAPVNLLDVYPTLIDLCGLKEKPELEGVSLLPLLKNPDADWERPSVTTFKYNNHSVRSRDWAISGTRTVPKNSMTTAWTRTNGTTWRPSRGTRASKRN